MTEPTNTSEMRRFLGMINHQGKFLPNLVEKNTAFERSPAETEYVGMGRATTEGF